MTPKSTEAAEQMSGARAQSSDFAFTSRAQSLLRYSPAFVLFAIVIADAGRDLDPDLWGHVLYGRNVLAHHQLTFTNYVSYSAPTHPIFTHEWMTETMMAWIYGHFGILGLKFWKFALSGSTIVLLALIAAETGASRAIQFAVLLFAALCLGPEMQMRPQMFDFVIMSGLLFLLTRHNYRRRAPLWIAIPLMTLWANLHGGFFIGLAMLGIYAAAKTAEDLWFGLGWRSGIHLGALALAAALATLINPFGISVWGTVIDQVRNPITRMIIGDWLPLLSMIVLKWQTWGVGVFSYVLAIAMMGATAGFVVYRPRGADFPMVAIAAVMCIAPFIAARNVALATIAIVEPLARHAGLAGSVDPRGGPASLPGEVRHGAIAQIAVAILAMVVAIGTGLFSPRLGGMDLPIGAVTFMRQHQLAGNILNRFEWGGYLEWHLGGSSRVFIDTRYDLSYPRSVVADYVRFTFAKRHGDAVLDSYDHDFVLIAPGVPADRIMAQRRDWVLLYRDSTSELFARASSQAAKITGIPFNGSARPGSFP